MKKEEKKSILEEIEEFLEYLAQNEHDENKRTEGSLKNKFGEENYKKIYNLIGGKKIGALPKKEGDKRILILYINEEGLKFLEEFEREEKKLKISRKMLMTTVVLVLITFLALGTTIYFSNVSLKTQINLANQQNNLTKANIDLIKQTSSTNWANVEIYFGRPGQKRIILDVRSLTELKTNNVKDRYGLGFVIINSGKIGSGYVRLNPNSDEFIHAMIEPNHEIDINSQSAKEGIIRMKQGSCGAGEGYECNSAIIPHKEYELNLNFTCQFCQPTQRSFNVTIPLCIYHDMNEYNYCSEKYSLY